MAINARLMILIGVAAILATRYYLEKEYDKETIFWMYSILTLVLGLFSAYTVITDHSARAMYIPLTVISTVIAIIYYESDDGKNENSG